MAATARIRLDKDVCTDLDRSSRIEWLETDGLGSYACGTVAGANTRRYHGLLVSSAGPLEERKVLVSRVEEAVEQEGASRELGTAFYPDAVHPHGYSHLLSFEAEPLPAWAWALPKGKLKRTLAMARGLRGTVLRYEISGTRRPAVLRLRFLVAGRDHHALCGANGAVQRSFERHRFAEGIRDRVVYTAYEGVPPVTFVVPPGTEVLPAGAWYYRNEYPVERERGFACTEDLFQPFELVCPIAAGEPVEILLLVDQAPARTPAQILEAERARRGDLRLAGVPRSAAADRLARAADRFLVRLPDAACTLVAGYPWHTDRGRDAFLSLPELCLATGRLEEAREVLRTFLAGVDGGLVPVHRAAAGLPADYLSVDTTLWCFVAAERYLEAAGGDRTFEDELYPRMVSALERLLHGMRGMGVDARDGLLAASDPGAPLTWMNERVDTWVVTPRRGKPVEVQALFHRALAFAAGLARQRGRTEEAERFAAAAGRIQETFETAFFDEQAGWFADVLREDGSRDLALRPNQVLALALAPELASKEHARAALEAVARRLLTPVGPRTLAPGEAFHQPRCEGGPHQRAGSFHNGAVHPFLLGAWGEALLAFSPRRAQARKQLAPLLEGLLQRMATEGCLGTLPELYDGEEPFLPRGAFASATAVAGALRLLMLLDAPTGRTTLVPRSPAARKAPARTKPSTTANPSRKRPPAPSPASRKPAAKKPAGGARKTGRSGRR